MNIRVRKLVSILIITIILISIFPGSTINAQESLPNLGDYYFHSSWGGEGKQLLRPVDVAVTEDGRVYIVNMEFNRITILDRNGFIYNEIGGFGEGGGEFNLPLSIAINDVGEIFVSDTWNRRLQKFDSAGNHLLTFGTFGEGVGQIFAPMGIAIDDSGNLLVADSNKIIKFSSDGEFISEFGSAFSEPGAGNDEFNGPSDVAIDQVGNIYVVDHGNSRVQIFDSNFTYLDTIEINDEGYPVYPNNAAVDAGGDLYVTVNSKIFIFDTNDENYSLVETWGVEGTGLGQLGRPTGIFVESSTGDVYVTEETNHRVSVFNSDGTIKTAYGTPDLVDGYFYYPSDVTISNGEVFVSDQTNHRIQVFNKDGTFLRKWGEFGSGDGQFNGPWGIDYDSTGNLIVADSSNYRIQKFDPAGNWLSSHDVSQYFPADCTPEGYTDPICTPRGIAIDSKDYIFVTIGSHQGHNLVYKFNSSMEKQAEWQNGGSSIAVDADDNVYTTWANYVFIYSNYGDLLDQWGEGPGPYRGLRGMEVDVFGDIYTMDLWYGVIKKYAIDGTLLGTYGSLGNDPGQFAYGNEMAITEDGEIYAVDGENQRIQVIAPTLPDPDPQSGLILNGEFQGAESLTHSSSLLKPTSLDTIKSREAHAGLKYWVYGGSLDVSRTSTHTNESAYALQLGSVVDTHADQGISEAWAYQVFYVRPAWVKPVLKFNYNVFTNENINKSNFIAEIQDGVGLNNLDILVLDGFDESTPLERLEAGTDLGWQFVDYDLSQYRGQHIRLVFSNRNLYPDSQGIWSFVERVRVEDHSLKNYLPLIKR